MGLEGYATVTDLAHFRVTKSNTASEEEWASGLVTGVFKHIANSVYHLKYSNGDTLGVTGTHPLYSLDRQQFILVEDLRLGEKLLSKSGIVTLTEKTYDPTPQVVYNLEVGQWHNFLVGVSGVVAHNNCFPLAENPAGAFNEIKAKWAHTMAPAEMKEVQNAVNRIKVKDTSVYPFNDGEVFENSYLKSPNGQRLNTGETYTEWTVKTPGISNRGERRIVVSNQTGRAYYTHDHYKDFIEVVLSGWK